MPTSLVPLYGNTYGGNDQGTVLEQTHSAAGGSWGDWQGEGTWASGRVKKKDPNRGLYTIGGAIVPSLVPRLTSENREKPKRRWGWDNTTWSAARRYQIPDPEVLNHRGGVWCRKQFVADQTVTPSRPFRRLYSILTNSLPPLQDTEKLRLSRPPTSVG